ncbi:YrbL family protein [Arcobacter sp. CECT 8983]|uniref:YrbL family protein n=1 Tax=Arcobacter sp. CECT 8983 TaxID=2044508 RepID=UPI0013E9083A|nr:YrbL family protein [Arcobacter sp. CECT 8983]
MSFINLNKKNYLGKGRERACYLHPEDDSKVVKVVYKPLENLNQNELEYEYLKYLEKKDIPFSHLSKCYGKVHTNLGEGYIFERIKDYNGETSTSFKNVVMNGLLSSKLEIELLNELKKYLHENSIIFVDVALSNVFCQKISEDNYKLVLTDGIGGKRMGLKSKLYLYSKLFTKYKVKKQLKKLDSRYKKVIKQGIEAKTRLLSE